MLTDKKGFLGSLLDRRSVLGGSLGQNQSQAVNTLIKKLESAGKRAGAVYKRQRVLDAKVDAIMEKLGIEMKEKEVAVDYGQAEIQYFQELIKDVEDDGDDVGLLTKIKAMNKLLSLFSKMTENIGRALMGEQRTELKVNLIEQHLKNIKEEDAGSKETQHP